MNLPLESRCGRDAAPPASAPSFKSQISNFQFAVNSHPSRHIRFPNCLFPLWDILTNCGDFNDVCSSPRLYADKDRVYIRRDGEPRIRNHFTSRAVGNNECPFRQIAQPYKSHAVRLHSLASVPIVGGIKLVTGNPTPYGSQSKHRRIAISRRQILLLMPLHRPLLRLGGRSEVHTSPNHRKDQQTNDDALPHKPILTRSPFTNQPPKPAITKSKKKRTTAIPSPSGRRSG